MAEQNPTGSTGGAQAPVFGSGETVPETGENIQVAQALSEAFSEAIAQAGPEGAQQIGQTVIQLAVFKGDDPSVTGAEFLLVDVRESITAGADPVAAAEATSAGVV